MNNNFLRTKFKEIIFLFLSAIITFFLLFHESTDGYNYYFNKYSTKYFLFLVIFISNLFVLTFLLLKFQKNVYQLISLLIYFILTFFILNHFYKTDYIERFTQSIFLNKEILIYLFLAFLFQILQYINYLYQFFKTLVLNILSFSISIKSFLFLILIVFLIIFVFELFVRIFVDKDVTNIVFKNNDNKKFINFFQFENFPYRNQSHPYIGYVMKSNHKVKHIHKDINNTKYEIEYFTNSDGFRDLELSNFVKKNSNEKLVIFLGGSFSLGVGTSNYFNIDEILERKLNQLDSEYKYKVLNLSIGAGIAYQSFLALDLYAKNLDPDYIILSDGRNDGFVSFVHGHGPKSYSMYPSIRFFINNYLFNQPVPSYNHNSTLNFLLKYSRIVQIITGKKHVDTISLEKILNKKIPFSDLDESLNFYLKSTDNIVSHFPDSKIVFATQPLYHKILDTEYNELKFKKFFDANKKLDSSQVDYWEFAKYWITLVSNSMRKYQNLPNVEHIDTNSFFKNYDIKELNKMFIDDSHLTKSGNEVFVEKLISIIWKDLNKK